ncbi:ubiquitin-like domain-containing protein [Nonomuraea sp. NPDC050310]|uniref:resuscitation-promoting factor n=1 Tax=unclassified Nonomuraea TaxID=2593643 RepID=UPI0034116052
MSGTRRKPRARSPWLGPWALLSYGAAALLVTAGTTALSMGKEIQLVVDERVTAMRTSAGTVFELLDEADISVGPHDYVSAARQGELEDGARIEIRRARRVEVVVDGEPVTGHVTADDVGGALEQLDIGPGRVSAPRTSTLPVSGLTVFTERKVELVKGENRSVMYTTGASVREVLKEKGVRLGPGDRVTPALDSFPKQGTVIRVMPVAPVPPSVARLNWAALAECESKGNPQAVNSAGGYYGLYQFSLPMWRAVGGTRTPIAWPEAEQTYRAQLLYQRVAGRWQGQWPNCGGRLFS